MEIVNDYSMNKLRKFINENYGLNFDELCKVLVDNNAIISGGLITMCLIEEDNYLTDVDIYANVDNFSNVSKFLSDNLNALKKKYCSSYDESFLAKNKIISVTTMYSKKDRKYKIDLMSVKKDRNVIDVVKNFDLSCCQNYFDGKNIICLNSNTLKKKAFINKDYYNVVFEENTFTVKRLSKYMKRGFTIDMSWVASYKLESKPKKSYDSYSSYNVLYKKLLPIIIFHSVFNTTSIFNIYCKYHNGNKDKSYTQMIFNDDGLDVSDFRNPEDYIKKGMEDKLTEVIKTLLIDDYKNLNTAFISNYPNQLKIFKDVCKENIKIKYEF